MSVSRLTTATAAGIVVTHCDANARHIVVSRTHHRVDAVRMLGVALEVVLGVVENLPSGVPVLVAAPCVAGRDRCII